MKWISVKERLPEKETPVLVVHRGEIKIGCICWEYPTFEETFEAFPYWDDAIYDGQNWEWEEITFWMPLPPKPEDVEVRGERNGLF